MKQWASLNEALFAVLKPPSFLIHSLVFGALVGVLVVPFQAQAAEGSTKLLYQEWMPVSVDLIEPSAPKFRFEKEVFECPMLKDVVCHRSAFIHQPRGLLYKLSSPSVDQELEYFALGASRVNPQGTARNACAHLMWMQRDKAKPYPVVVQLFLGSDTTPTAQECRKGGRLS